MTTVLLITTDDKFKTIEYENSLDFLYKHIETDIVQVMRPHGLQRIGGLNEKFIMIVDEESLLKPNPKLNFYASTFCGTFIYGNAIIVKENYDDFEGLEKEDHEQISLAMMKLLMKLKK